MQYLYAKGFHEIPVTGHSDNIILYRLGYSTACTCILDKVSNLPGLLLQGPWRRLPFGAGVPLVADDLASRALPA